MKTNIIPASRTSNIALIPIAPRHFLSTALLSITFKSPCYSTDSTNKVFSYSNHGKNKSYTILYDISFFMLNKGFKLDENTRLAIESFIYDEFYNMKDKDINTDKGIDKDLFGPVASNFLSIKNKYLDNYNMKWSVSLCLILLLKIIPFFFQREVLNWENYDSFPIVLTMR